MFVSEVRNASTRVLDHFDERLEELRTEGIYRQFIPCSHLADDPGQTMHDGRRVQVWCTNDYLGLSQHPDVIDAQVAAVRQHGTGNGGSRNIAGTSAAHVELETRLADWHEKERALIFSSGYTANYESLSSLLSAVGDMVVFSDASNHRSLIEGMRRASGRKHVFKHNDLAELETLLAAYDRDRPKLIVFESVYSMDGDVAPVTAILDLADKYHALTFVDETHAIGIRGASGAGVCEELGEQHRATFIQGVFGKAMGTVGGYVAGPRAALDYVRSFAPGFIFTTALPTATVHATLRSLDLIQNGAAMRRGLMANVALLKNALRKAGVDFIDADSHIVPVMVPGSERVRRVSARLLEQHGIYVQPINFPSVPRGGERFRVTVPPYREPAQIERFVDAVRQSLSEY